MHAARRPLAPARSPAVPVGFRLSGLYSRPKDNLALAAKRHLRLILTNDYSSKQLSNTVVCCLEKKKRLKEDLAG